MAIAISASAATTLAGANAYTDGVALGLEGLIDANTSAIADLIEKTQNITASVPAVSTTFEGAVICDAVAADTGDFDVVNVNTINLTTAINGVGKLNLSASTGSNLIEAPSTTIRSQAGLGAIYLGNFTDIVYISGFAQSALSWAQW
jgi:hypothetical protein